MARESQSKPVIVTIDGPAGSGKSTVASKLANKLAFIHLNSGALFRAIGLIASRNGISPDDDDAVTALAKRTEFRFSLVDSEGADSSSEEAGRGSRQTELLVDGKSFGAELFTAEAGVLASRVALLPKLREVLVEVQRRVAYGGVASGGVDAGGGENVPSGVVLEGRDAGTVVFPDADVKFYLDAASEIRAQRRFAELQNRGAGVSFEELKAELDARDARDRDRPIAPQKQAEDAMLIDTSALSVDEVVEKLSEAVERRRAG